jgi:hypothetical protein
MNMEIDRTRLRRDRILFYAGLVLLLLGLPGMVLGSWLHEIMRFPIIGEVYDAWGWINQITFIVGLFMALVGGVFLALSLRGGAIDAKEAKESEGGT